MKIRALPGKVIVKFKPYERDGLIELPDSVQLPSVEAEVVHDGDGELEAGTRVIVSRMDGEYFDLGGEQLCKVKKASLLMQRL